MPLSKRVKVLLYSSNLWYLGEGMLGPLFAVFTERIGGDILDITWAWATYLIVTGILYILVGKFVDGHLNKAKVMVIGYGLNSLFTFGYLLVSSPIHLFFIQAGLGVAAALTNPNWLALYAKYEDRKHDGYTWGLFGGEGHIVTGLAMILGGFIVNYISFNVLFITMGTIEAIAAIYQMKILRKKQ